MSGTSYRNGYDACMNNAVRSSPCRTDVGVQEWLRGYDDAAITLKDKKELIGLVQRGHGSSLKAKELRAKIKRMKIETA